MSLTDRIYNPDRRLTALPVIIERRGGDERRLPRWIEWTREHEQAGSKDLTGREAA